MQLEIRFKVPRAVILGDHWAQLEEPTGEYGIDVVADGGSLMTSVSLACAVQR